MFVLVSINNFHRYRKSMLIICFILPFLTFMSGYTKNIPACSSHEQFKFRHVTIEDGLSDNHVNSIYQDKYGYTWIGTNNGLNKYNGLDFKQYKYNPNDSNSISSNLIHVVFRDSKGS